jgi:hypothetical protein
MFRLLVLSTAAVALGLLATNRATAAHPHLHHAIYELREAHAELEKAPHNFGGHKERALKDISAAYHQIEKCLEAVGDGYKGFNASKDLYKGYANHHHLRHALVELREAHAYLKESPNNFGGHKKKALEDINAAIKQVEICIKEIKE